MYKTPASQIPTRLITLKRDCHEGLLAVKLEGEARCHRRGHRLRRGRSAVAREDRRRSAFVIGGAHHVAERGQDEGEHVGARALREDRLAEEGEEAVEVPHCEQNARRHHRKCV